MVAAFISVNNQQSRFYISGLFTTDKTWNTQPAPMDCFVKWPPGGFPAPPLIQPSLLPKLAGDTAKTPPCASGCGVGHSRARLPCFRMMFVQTEVLSGLSRAHFQLQMGKLETKQRSLNQNRRGLLSSARSPSCLS